jgi:hypothetical protein
MGVGVQKSPIFLIGALKHVPARPLGAAIGVTFQLASFGKHVAEPFTSALLFAVVSSLAAKPAGGLTENPTQPPVGQSMSSPA